MLSVLDRRAMEQRALQTSCHWMPAAVGDARGCCKRLEPMPHNNNDKKQTTNIKQQQQHSFNTITTHSNTQNTSQQQQQHSFTSGILLFSAPWYKSLSVTTCENMLRGPFSESVVQTDRLCRLCSTAVCRATCIVGMSGCTTPICRLFNIARSISGNDACSWIWWRSRLLR